MNRDLLLKYFDRISDAPDAIPGLRQFILDLAVRGKLVEQDPTDEPTVELLRRIHAIAIALAQVGRIRKHEELPPVAVQNRLFELPESWEWVRFGQIAQFSAGRTPSRHESRFWNTGDYPWVSIADLNDGGLVVATKETVSTKAKIDVFGSEPVAAGTVVMSFKLTIGKISRLGLPAFHNEAIISIHPHLPTLEAYLFMVLPRFARLGMTKDAIKGATLNRDSIANIFIPLPPVAEQHRIVAKVNELMALCDRLETAQEERESRRDRLVAASLHSLDNGSDAEALREHARFYLHHLPRMSTRSEHVKQLRETILNSAVRGQLASQDSNDEPAAELLVRIQAEKTRLANAGLISKFKPALIGGGTSDVEHLATWQSVRLGDVCSLVTSGSRGWAEFYSENGPKFIRAQNIRFGKLRLDDLACVTPPKNAEGSRTQVSKGDLLIVITGAGVTNPALLDRDLGEAYVSQHVALIRPVTVAISRWLLLCLMAPAAGRAVLVDRAYGAGKPGLNLDNIRSLNIPIPPLAEQCRILAKVDELMALCDQLETQLHATQTESRRLLEAVLSDALAMSAHNERLASTISSRGEAHVN